MTRHQRPLTGTHARELEALLGLKPWSLRSVEHEPARRTYLLRFRQQLFAGRSRRVFRIPAKRVIGYEQRSPTARLRDVRYRADLNRRRMALWLFARLGIAAPVVELALLRGDLGAIDELGAAILLAAGGGVDDVQLWLEQDGAA